MKVILTLLLEDDILTQDQLTEDYLKFNLSTSYSEYSFDDLDTNIFHKSSAMEDPCVEIITPHGMKKGITVYHEQVKNIKQALEENLVKIERELGQIEEDNKSISDIFLKKPEVCVMYLVTEPGISGVLKEYIESRAKDLEINIDIIDLLEFNSCGTMDEFEEFIHKEYSINTSKNGGFKVTEDPVTLVYLLNRLIKS